MLVFSKDKPHTICLCALRLPSHSHLRTRNELPPLQLFSYLRASLAVLWEGGRRRVCAPLRCAEVSQIDPWLQSRQLPGAADIEPAQVHQC